MEGNQIWSFKAMAGEYQCERQIPPKITTFIFFNNVFFSPILEECENEGLVVITNIGTKKWKEPGVADGLMIVFLRKDNKEH